MTLQIQFTAGIFTVLIGSYFIIMNWIVVVTWFVRRKHSSWIPIVGGCLAAIGILVLPFPQLRRTWWIPLLIDFGCVPGLLWTILGMAIAWLRRWNSS